MTVPLFQENVLRELFEANVFKLLVCEALITAELIAKIRTWRHSGFHVYAGPTIAQKEDAVRVGLYPPGRIRAPASASRLALAEDGLLKYLAKGSVPDPRCDPLFEPNGQILDPLEWIAKLTLQGAQIHLGGVDQTHLRIGPLALPQMSYPNDCHLRN